MPTILIAEDNEDLRGMLREMLEAGGYLVSEAANGHEAVAAAVGGRPDLIIMDLGMPGLDGLAAVAEIRQHAHAADTPILIISAFDRLEYRTEAVGAGCAFLAKPIDPRSLLMTVKLLLHQEDGDAVAV